MSNIAWSFDDVIMPPKFTDILSRKDVDPSMDLWGMGLKLPIISSNMDSVTGLSMAISMTRKGAAACLHRFQSIEDNVATVKSAEHLNFLVSVGLGDKELERAQALYDAGARRFVVDVAHGANMSVVKQVQELRKFLKSDTSIIAGNFATKQSIEEFLTHVGRNMVDGFKVGIGGGSACITRKVTGCGLPTLASVIECSRVGYPIIADGGIRDKDDVCKALAAGASAVMLGYMLAGTDESLGEMVTREENVPNPDYAAQQTVSSSAWSGSISWQTQPLPYIVRRVITHKKYRGSASQESYDVQGKTAEWRTPEGESFLVPYVGPVATVLQGIEAGLRSCMTYQNAKTIAALWDNATFRQVSTAGAKEGSAHGKAT